MLAVDDPITCGEAGIALGDLDGDGTPEIVTSLIPCTDATLVAFAPECNCTQKLPSPIPFSLGTFKVQANRAGNSSPTSTRFS